MEVLNTLGDRLAWAMKRRGVKNPDVARAAGVVANTVSKWRNDVQPPSEPQLHAVATFLGFSAAWLRYGIGTWPDNPRDTETSAIAAKWAIAEARNRAGLSLEAAAKTLGVSVSELRSWEDGDPRGSNLRITDLLNLYGLTYGELQSLADTLARERLGSRSPAATGLGAPPSGLPRQLRILAAEFEVEVVKMGANEDEVAWVRHSLQNPESARMFSYGFVSRDTVSEEARKADFIAYIDALRTVIKMRVKKRRDPAEAVGRGLRLDKK